ncbi:MAG: hypothetical protein AB1782_19990 [Cyanobacteriota bacterium]
MLGILLAASLTLKGIIGFQNPNNVSEFYTSGIGEKKVNQEYYNDTGFAVLSIPFAYRYNNYNDFLPGGYYQLQPIYENEVPTQINLRQTGKVVGIITVCDYKELSYEKENPSATIEMINHGKMAQITLKTQKHEIYAIIEMVNIVP